MRVLLVNASFRVKRNIIGDSAMIQPMGVACLAAYLRMAGNTVEIYEPTVYGGTFMEHYERIRGYDCDVIGFSQCAAEYKNESLGIIKLVRRGGFRGVIVLGGHSPSLSYEEYLNECKEIDCISIGEGEKTLDELMHCLENGEDWHRIDGIAYYDMDSECIVRTNPRELIEDIDALPFPARDVLAWRVKYVGKKAVATILSSRGCYQNCSFCSVATYYNLQCGKRFRYRSVGNIVDEIREIYERYGITDYSFIDDNFILPGNAGIRRCKEFCSLVSELPFKIQFEVNTRIDTIEKEAIRYLKDSGLTNISIGIESFLKSDLEVYNKRITLEQIENALRALMELGFSTEVGSTLRIRTFMIVFNPFSTIEGLRLHLSYLKKYRVSPKKMVTILTVYDHTDIKRRLVQDGLLTGGNNWVFRDRRVKYVYDYFAAYVKKIMTVRERIRNMQKHMKQNGIETGNFDLDCARRMLDESCYVAFESLLV